MKLSAFAVILAALALGFSNLRGYVGLVQAAPSGAWLDSATPNWNTAGAPVPQSPAPTSPSAQSTHNWWTGVGSPDGPSILMSSLEEKKYFGRCKSLVRPGTLPEDTLLEDAGWVLFGQAHVFGKITVVMAMAAVDGMCRPSQYQAFVFFDGRFAGSLSPGLMDSRTDGSIETIQFVQDPRAPENDPASGTMVPYASFQRYQASDPLCCPSATSAVIYGLQIEGDRRVVVPQLPAQTSANCSR